MKPKLTAQIPWQISKSPSGWWVGHSPLLKITTQGRTREELEARIAESHSLLFEDLVESGDLETFLFVHGWSPVSGGRVTAGAPVITLEMLEDIPVNMKDVDASDFAAAPC